VERFVHDSAAEERAFEAYLGKVAGPGSPLRKVLELQYSRLDVFFLLSRDGGLWVRSMSRTGNSFSETAMRPFARLYQIQDMLASTRATLRSPTFPGWLFHFYPAGEGPGTMRLTNPHGYATTEGEASYLPASR
jgi:hypothetical protein